MALRVGRTALRVCQPELAITVLNWQHKWIGKNTGRIRTWMATSRAPAAEKLARSTVCRKPELEDEASSERKRSTESQDSEQS